MSKAADFRYDKAQDLKKGGKTVPLDVKAAVADALLELIRRKDADKITVKDLVEVCGISRQTFYYHLRTLWMWWSGRPSSGSSGWCARA